MSETILFSSSNSVDKAIDEVVLVALVILVIATVVVEETPQTSNRCLSTQPECMEVNCLHASFVEGGV